MATHIVALFDDQAHAQDAVQNLNREGLTQSKISVIAADKSGEKMAAQKVGHDGNLGGEGAKAGISTGAIVGGVVGLLAGIGLGFVPFLGFLVAGPVAGLLTGAAAGAVTGGALGGLVGLGIPEDEISMYEESVRQGGYLVIADVEDSKVDRFEGILNNAGAVDIDERMAMRRAGTSAPSQAQPSAAPTYAASAPPAPRPQAPAPTQNVDRAEAGDKLEVVEEKLNVGKREIESGGVRVRRFVTEKPVTAEVQLREEHVNVERKPVDRAADASDFKEKVIEVRETAEVPVVAKEARVVEEVTVGKTVETHTEKISDTVRRTDVEIQQLEGENRAHFDKTYSGKNYDTYKPAYDYGMRVAEDSRFRGRAYDEATVKSEFQRSNPNSAWEEMKDAVRSGYESAKAKL